MSKRPHFCWFYSCLPCVRSGWVSTALLLVAAAVLPMRTSGAAVVASHPEYLVGVYYFSGWSRQPPDRWFIDGHDWRTNWPDRIPVLGQYNDQATMDREIVTAAEHGVRFFQLLWYPAGQTPKEWMEHPLNSGLKHFLASTNRHRLKFTLECVNHPPFELKSEEAWRAACQEWVKAMQDDSYLKLGGRPIFKIHGLHHFLAQNNHDTTRVAARLKTLRSAAQGAGLAEPLIGGGVMASEVNTLESAAQPYDFLTTYMDMPALGKAEKPYPYHQLLAYAEAAWKAYGGQRTGPYVPYVPAGWDPRPWKDPRSSFEFPTRAEWITALRDVKAALLTNSNLGVRLPTGERQKVFLIYAWNEFGEGGIVAPTRGEGAMKLEAIREVFGTPERH